MYKYFSLFISLLFVAGCSSTKVHYELPPDWKDEVTRNETIKKYSEFVAGKKIFIDPGHGGEDRYNKGKLELVTEADINLKVGLYLRDYLQKAGAVVFMSREKDETVLLQTRSDMANSSGAELFVSIHHNAPGAKEDDWTDYTSTYYHAFETDFEYEPCNRDIARFVQRDLSYVMDNPGGLGSFDGTYSDYMIYPKMGFSVLRLTKIPCVLVEGGFFTNNYEEQRLSLDEFNQIQAWGIFRGLAKYFKVGIPQIIPLYDEANEISSRDTILTFALEDKSGINPKAISVYLDSLQTKFDFNTLTKMLCVPISGLQTGDHTLRIICANHNENHSLPFTKKIRIKPELN
ncbi:MAG: N-acetylmuramoyl-L-alanine amidase [Ignavibacteriales bacterium]|nr:N-acetylmuramoyl-L-alanine amidase [Ignavibacteriales bacterium]